MVAVILAFLAAIAIPRVATTIRHQKLDAASRRLMIDLELTRAQAVHDGVNRTLTLSLANHYYDIPTEAGMGRGSRVQLNAPPYDGVTIAATSYSPAEVVFTRLGIPEPAATGTITLQVGPESVIISVSATSGRATREFGM